MARLSRSARDTRLVEHLAPRLSRCQGMRKPSHSLAAAVLSAAVLGAAAPSAYAALEHRSAPHAAPAPYVETHLLFGTARPDGGPAVSRKEFQDFVDQAVTPRFPAGLTITQASGQYRDRHGVIERERSYEIYLLYPSGDASSADASIEEVRALYVARFHQESVARVDEHAQVKF